VIQIQQHLQRLLNNRMRLPPLDVHHEPHAARLVLEPRVVQTLLGRWAGPLRLTAITFAVCSDRHFREIGISTLILTKFSKY
jgi:hypothetical protein